MKPYIKHILFVLLFALPMLANATEQSVKQICSGFTAGDVKSIETLFDSQVEISILGESVVCGKEYALERIADFVSNNPSSTCKVSHHGKRESSSFCIISIASAGKSYRLYALFRKVSNNQLIQQFRIDDVTE